MEVNNHPEKFYTILLIFLSPLFFLSPSKADTDAIEAGFGTGWALTSRHIVTANHVIADAKYVSIPIENKRFISARVLINDPINDLAILELEEDTIQLKPLPLANRSARIGTQVFTIGFPLPGLMGIEPKLTTGIINARSGLQGDRRTYQISVPVQSGNSGGPLLNMQGEVVGITTFKLAADRVHSMTGDVVQNVNYAIKIAYLRPLIEDADLDIGRPGTPPKHRSLDELATRISPSVFLVVAHNRPLPTGKDRQHAIAPTETPEPKRAIKDSITILAYAEPGRYDINENIIGSSTLEEFSLNLTRTIQQQIADASKNSLNIRWPEQIEPKYAIAKIDFPEKRKFYCEKYGTTWIFSAITEAEPGANARDVTYRIANCTNQRYFKKSYTIRRAEQFDRYGYETELESSLRQFFNDIPSLVMEAP